jgi:hemerythrin-like metal-binding protein
VTRWLPDYAIGVQVVDAEHQGLFALAAKLHHSILSDHAPETLGQVLKELIDYTCYHFAHEEELMQRIGYPHFAAHCDQHEALRAQVLVMQERYTAGEHGMPMNVLQFVTDWLKCHTTTSDRRIGSYMRKRGLV